jgi:two-component system sensor histidine kinase TctE
VPPASSSLRRQLLFWLLTPLVLIVPAVAALQYRFIVEPALQEFDHQLSDIALAVSNLIRVEDGNVRFEMTPQTERSLRTDRVDSVYFVVAGPDHAVLAGEPALYTPGERVAPGAWRFADRQLDGQPLRVAMHSVPCGRGSCEVRVGETLVKRERVRNHALALSLIVVALLGALTAGAAWAAVTLSLRPLRALRDELERRSLDNLDRLEAARAPAEVRPLVATLNRLFDRVQAGAAAQRAFVSDAAHQLRTPLAALRTESELALLAPHPESLRPVLEGLNRSATRAAHLAAQLLTVARLDREAQLASERGLVDLREVAADAAQEWSPRAIAAEADLGFDLKPATVLGQRWLLREALSNLIHNALEYCRRPARITVRTYVHEGAPVLEVEDDGPGIDAQEIERVQQRFVRGRAATGDGSGLGLAIVREVAALHGAVLALEPCADGAGLLARMRFVAPPAAGRA